MPVLPLAWAAKTAAAEWNDRRMKHRTVKTAYGKVDAKTLEKLRDTFETGEIYNVIGILDGLRYRIDGLRQDLADLYAMATDVINEDPEAWRPMRDEPTTIFDLAESLSSELFDLFDGLEHAYKAIEELQMLAPQEDWGDEDEAA